MRIQEVFINSNYCSTRIIHDPQSDAELKKEDQVEVLRGIVGDFVQLDGDFDLKLPDLAPDTVDPVTKEIRREY